jgi:hypothetical protein
MAVYFLDIRSHEQTSNPKSLDSRFREQSCRRRPFPAVAVHDSMRTSSLKVRLAAGAKDQACPPTEWANSMYCSLPFSLPS